MAIETERKFLLANDGWRGLAPGKHYRQGYLNGREGATVRVRTVGDIGYLTIKGPTVNTSRLEYEYPIPVEDAVEMLDKLTVSTVVEKVRYAIPFAGFVGEVDEFLGDNLGLVIAGIELAHPEQPFSLPPWIGVEVTGDPRYYNSYLARTPFTRWETLR